MTICSARVTEVVVGSVNGNKALLLAALSQFLGDLRANPVVNLFARQPVPVGRTVKTPIGTHASQVRGVKVSRIDFFGAGSTA